MWKHISLRLQAGCVPYTAIFTNTSLAGETFEWDFGDGTTFTGANSASEDL